MYDLKWEHYQEVVKRIKEQTPDFNTDKLQVLIAEDNAIDGIDIPSFTLSKDNKWICVPYEDEDIFLPKCYEVAGILETFLPYGSMSCRTTIYLLHKS